MTFSGLVARHWRRCVPLVVALWANAAAHAAGPGLGHHLRRHRLGLRRRRGDRSARQHLRRRIDLVARLPRHSRGSPRQVRGACAVHRHGHAIGPGASERGGHSSRRRLRASHRPTAGRGAGLLSIPRHQLRFRVASARLGGGSRPDGGSQNRGGQAGRLCSAQGHGATNLNVPAGTTVSGAPATMTAPTVMVGGVAAEVVSTVLTTGCAGLYQVTIRIPPAAPAGRVAVQASVGGVRTAGGVSIFVGQ
jgi:hypothetical protein